MTFPKVHPAILALSLSLGLPAVASPQEPRTLVRPLRVYVFTEAGRGSKQERTIADTTDEIRKKLQGRKKWFRVVGVRDEADVVVEVLRVWSDVDNGQKFARVDRTTQPGSAELVGFLDVRETFHIEAELRVGDERPEAVTTSGEADRAKDLSKRFASELQDRLEPRLREPD